MAPNPIPWPLSPACPIYFKSKQIITLAEYKKLSNASVLSVSKLLKNHAITHLAYAPELNSGSILELPIPIQAFKTELVNSPRLCSYPKRSCQKNDPLGPFTPYLAGLTSPNGFQEVASRRLETEGRLKVRAAVCGHIFQRKEQFRSRKRGLG